MASISALMARARRAVAALHPDHAAACKALHAALPEGWVYADFLALFPADAKLWEDPWRKAGREALMVVVEDARKAGGSE